MKSSTRFGLSVDVDTRLYQQSDQSSRGEGRGKGKKEDQGNEKYDRRRQAWQKYREKRDFKRKTDANVTHKKKDLKDKPAWSVRREQKKRKSLTKTHLTVNIKRKSICNTLCVGKEFLELSEYQTPSFFVHF